MFGFTEGFRKLTTACRGALDFATELPKCGKLEKIDFRFGAPTDGKLPFYIIRNGHPTHLGDLCDSYPPFEKMRGWMERTMTLSSIGCYSPEVLNLDCSDHCLMLMIAQSDWSLFPNRSGEKVLRPVSVLAILQSGMNTPKVQCFCRTDCTIGNLYRALSDVLTKYGPLFDNPSNWILYERKWINPRKFKTSDVIREQIESPDLIFFRKNYY